MGSAVPWLWETRYQQLLRAYDLRLTVARLMTAAKSATRTHAARVPDRHHRKYVSFRQYGFRRIVAKHAGAQLGEVS